MRVPAAIFLAAIGLGLSRPALGWGDRTHRWLAHRAVETVSGELRPWLDRHREALGSLAVEPDTILRERQGRREAVRHYIDLDLYGQPPFRRLPRIRAQAERAFGREVVAERGTLPWRILELYDRLVRQLRARDWDRALRTAGLAGHYVGDAFMPLHTTANHDGQRTGNRGVHRAIEEALVDAHLDRFDRRVRSRIGAAVPGPWTADRVFGILIESHSRADGWIRADLAARSAAAPDTAAYAEALDARLGDSVAERLARAAETLGSFWVSAWREAGSPRPPASAQAPRGPAAPGSP